MTLLRQLVIVIITLFTLLFIGTMAINIHNTRNYLNSQLRTISQDTATSLGVSLSPHMAKGEMAIIESKISAVSDGGGYREVVVTDINGKAIIERTQPVVTKDIPAWFVNFVALDTPRGEAQLLAGWKQSGKIRVSANPSFAYASLWGNSVTSFWWFLGFSGFAVLLGVIVLRYILQPLRTVEAQAKAICNREYLVQDQVPWTLELRNVVIAMNMMSNKVKEMFKEQADALERMRADTYVDALTGLANRKYFDIQLGQMAKTRTSSASNALIFIELNEFQNFNERKGYRAGVELLRGCGALIGEVCKEVPNLHYSIARMNGATFAILIQDIAEEGARAFAEALCLSLNKLQERGLTDASNIGHIGVAIHHGQPAGQLLSEADMALKTAQVKGSNAVHVNDSKTADEYSSFPISHWMEVLSNVLTECRITLHRQAIMSCKDDAKISQYEVLLRIYDNDGKLIPANRIIPMAKHLHLTQEFDKQVVSETLARLGRPENANAVMAVNLFPMSIQDSGFIAWLCDTLHKHADVAPRIAFELMEHGATENLDALRGWVERIAQTGAQTGLDQVGKGFHSFNYLSELKLNYIKIDGSYARDIQGNKDNQAFVDSLVKFAHGIGLYVIAESVETIEERNMLRSLRVDGVKGYGVSKPVKWD